MLSFIRSPRLVNFAAVILCALCGLSAMHPSHAAAWPERTITIVVPFQPGGASDSLGRVLIKPLTEALGKTVVIENRPGAGGNIGISAVARARPDGYTLLLTSSVIVVNSSLYKNAGFDPIKDFTPISDSGASPNVIATRADSGINSLNEMLALARNKPDYLNYSSGGIGVTPQDRKSTRLNSSHT